MEWEIKAVSSEGLITVMSYPWKDYDKETAERMIDKIIGFCDDMKTRLK